MKKLACFVLILMSSVSYAGTKANSITLTLGGGNDYFSSKRHIDNTGVGYGAIGYNFTEHWGIEGFIGSFNTNSRLTVDHGKHVNGTIYAVDGLYHIATSTMIEPYLLAGVGVISMNPNGYDANNEGNLNAAVGLNFFLADPVSLRVEARDFYTFVGGKNDIFLNAGITANINLC